MLEIKLKHKISHGIIGMLDVVDRWVLNAKNFVLIHVCIFSFLFK